MINRLALFSIVFSIFSLLLYIIDFSTLENNLKGILLFVWLILIIMNMIFLYKNKNIILLVFIALNLITQLYFLMNVIFYTDIVLSGPFDFRAYKWNTLSKVVDLMFLVFSLLFIVVYIYAKKLSGVNKLFSKSLIYFQINLFLKRITNQNILIWSVILITISLLVFFLTGSVLDMPYPLNHNVSIIHFPPTIRPLIVMPIFMFYIVLKLKARGKNIFRVVFYKLILFFSMFIVIFSHGARGSAVGLLILLLVFDFLTDKNTLSKLNNLLVTSLLLYISIVMWPLMRHYIYNLGLVDSLIGAFERLTDTNVNFFDVQFSLIPMIPQTLFHFLYVVDLINDDISLGYNTFINLIPQQMPGFLEAIFGERPLNDNWQLSKYFFHGGGFYIFANAYWNNGLWGLVPFTLVIGWVLVRIEIFFKNVNDMKYFIAYPIFFYLIPVSIFYGIQPFVRALEFGLVAIFVIFVFKKVRIKKT